MNARRKHLMGRHGSGCGCIKCCELSNARAARMEHAKMERMRQLPGNDLGRYGFAVIRNDGSIIVPKLVYTLEDLYSLGARSAAKMVIVSSKLKHDVVIVDDLAEMRKLAGDGN